MKSNKKPSSKHKLTITLFDEALKNTAFIKGLTKILIQASKKIAQIKSPAKHVCRGQIWRDQHSIKRQDRLILVLGSSGDALTCQSLQDHKIGNIRREQFGRGRTGYEYVVDVQALKEMMQKRLQ